LQRKGILTFRHAHRPNNIAGSRLKTRAARYRVVRLDSCGSLIGTPVNEGLVDEVSLLVHSESWPPHMAPAVGAELCHRLLALLALISNETLDRGLVWWGDRVPSSTTRRADVPRSGGRPGR
jgi:hypothetical protein